MNLATSTLKAEHARLWMNTGPDSVEFFYDKEMKHIHMKHDMKTYKPQCDIICTTDDWQTHILGEMTDALKMDNGGVINFKHKLMQVALKRMEVYNTKITGNKLLTDATSKGHNCAVMTFVDIGTYVTYEY